MDTTVNLWRIFKTKTSAQKERERNGEGDGEENEDKTETGQEPEEMGDSTAGEQNKKEMVDDNVQSQKTAESSDPTCSNAKCLRDVLQTLKKRIEDPKFIEAADILLKDCEDPTIKETLIKLLYPVMDYIERLHENTEKKQVKASSQEISTVKVHRVVSGETFGAHTTLIEEIESDKALTLVQTPEKECDVILVFCPISSRPGSDVKMALSKIKGNKPIILVVMHHTRKPDYPTKGIDLTDYALEVHALFHETQHGLLDCQKNADTISQIKQELQKYSKKKKSSWYWP